MIQSTHAAHGRGRRIVNYTAQRRTRVREAEQREGAAEEARVRSGMKFADERE
jgi:hypothetical protein